MSFFRKIITGKKAEYQTFERITYQEVDDARNFKMKTIPEKALYETNRAKSEKERLMFKMTSKDYSSEGRIRINIIDPDEIRKDCPDYGSYGYLNISCVQILVKWLGNAGVNIPLKIAMIDERLSDPKQGIIGLYSTNLFSGAAYTEIHTDFTLSMKDQNLSEAFVIIIDPTINMTEGSRAISIGINTYMNWNEFGRAYRVRDSEGINTGSLRKGKSVVIKSQRMDVRAIPQPIPVDKLDYDLDFAFPKARKVITQAGTSTEVEHTYSTKKELHVRLSEPILTKGAGPSKRFNTDQFKDLFQEG